MKKYKINIKHPHVGYPGSIIQQNYGEQIKKGYYVWDIKSKNLWDVQWKKLDNLAPFVTLSWEGNVKKTLEKYQQLHKNYAFTEGSRYRIVSNYLIPSVQREELTKELIKHAPAEIIFKTNAVTNLDSFNAHNTLINKKSLTQDPDTVFSLYKKFIISNIGSFVFDNNQFNLAYDVIKEYLNKFNASNKEGAKTKHAAWSIKFFEFDNLYGYGEKNKINFENLNDIVGIFGPNRSGKSSLMGALSYTLFNVTDRGSINNALVVNRNKNKAYGAVRITVGNQDFLIERTTEKIISRKNADQQDKSNTTVNLWKIENKNGVEVKVSDNGDTRNDTDKRIRNLIGTPEDFLLTAFASQENINKFISNKATKRKEILNRFLELDVFDKLYNFAKDDYTDLNARSKNLSVKDWDVLIRKIQNDIQLLDKDIERINTAINNTLIKRDEVKFWVDSHQKEISNVDPLFQNKIENHIQNLEAQIEEYKTTIAKNRSNLRKIKMDKKIAEKKVKKIDLVKIQQDMQEMNNLKETLSNLKNTFKFENEKHENQKKAIRKLELVPCGNSFPNCHFIKDSHEAKTTIKQQKSIIKTLEKGIESSQRLFDKYVKKGLEESLLEHNTLNQNIKYLNAQTPILEDSITNMEKNIPILSKELRSNKAKLKKYQNLTSDKTTEEFNRKNAQLISLTNEIKKLEEQKSQYYLSLGGKNDSMKKLKEEQDLNKNLIKKLKVYDSIQSAFSKNGIPAMVLKNQLPAINKEIEKTLEGLTDFEITLKTDTSANIMDVYLKDKKGQRIIELCSGMEKTMCSLALRVALGNLSSLARPDILVLDESFGALDEENLQTGLEMLALLKHYFKTIFIITHSTPIKEIADSIIEIKHNGIESEVIV